MSEIIEIKNNEELIKVFKDNEKVLVDFKADWCGPCKMLHPILIEFSKNNPNVKVVEVDVDKNPDIAANYKIMSIPALKLFNKEKLMKESTGFMSQTQLEIWIK